MPTQNHHIAHLEWILELSKVCALVSASTGFPHHRAFEIDGPGISLHMKADDMFKLSSTIELVDASYEIPDVSWTPSLHIKLLMTVELNDDQSAVPVLATALIECTEAGIDQAIDLGLPVDVVKQMIAAAEKHNS